MSLHAAKSIDTTRWTCQLALHWIFNPQISLKPLLSKIKTIFAQLCLFCCHSPCDNRSWMCAYLWPACGTNTLHLFTLAYCNELACSFTSREAYHYSNTTMHISCSQLWHTTPRVCTLVLSFYLFHYSAMVMSQFNDYLIYIFLTVSSVWHKRLDCQIATRSTLACFSEQNMTLVRLALH